MSNDFDDLLGVNSIQTLQFFYEHLKEEVVPRRLTVTSTETLYVASVLAHFAQTSRCDPHDILLADLSEVFDLFILSMFKVGEAQGMSSDPEILESMGSNILLFAGFFRDQTKRRHNAVHNVSWYDHLGKNFYERASQRNKENKDKRLLLERIAFHFPLWTRTCQNVSRTMKDKRYLLKLET